MRTIRFGILVILAIAWNAHAAMMLDVQPEGRAAAMGDATVPTGTGPASIWGNPAGIYTNQQAGAVFGTHRWIADIKGTHIAGSLKWNDFAGAVTIQNASSEDLERRDIPTFSSQGTFGVRETEFGVGIAYQYTPKFRIGAASGYRYNRIEDDVETEWHSKIGVQYEFLPNLYTGVILDQIGAKTSNDGQMLPRGGAEYTYDLPAGNSVNTAIDLRLVEKKVRAGLGLELSLFHIFALRSGYQFGYESQGFSYGVGASWKLLKINLGIAPFQNDLGTTTRISIEING